MTPAARLVTLEGRLVIVVDGEHARLLDALLTQAIKARYALGASPVDMEPAHRISRTAARAAACRTFGIVPHGVPEVALGAGIPGEWVTVNDAAAELGITPRSIRKRIGAGTMPARRVGRDWLVNICSERQDAA